jgi:hypothetical protein
VRAIDSAFVSPDEAAAALGGSLRPGERMGFVPFRFLELVRGRYRVVAVDTLPSFRNRLLGRLERDGGLAALAAESATLTSAVYRFQEGDTRFLFFTENVFWPRPFFGAANLAYGLGSAALGLFGAPFGRAGDIAEGLGGALFSLPELAFGNIRKGSFDGIAPPAAEAKKTGG